MASVAELRAAIVEALPVLRAAIEGAGAASERVPPGAAADDGTRWDGGRARSPSMSYSATTTSPARSRQPSTGRQLGAPSWRAARPPRRWPHWNAPPLSSTRLVAAVEDHQLAAATRFGRPVEWVAALAARHRLDHAAQIESACAAAD